MDSGKLKLPLLSAANSTGNFRPTQLRRSRVIFRACESQREGDTDLLFAGTRLVFHERANRGTTDASSRLIYDKCSKPPGVDYDARQRGKKGVVSSTVSSGFSN